MLLTADLEGTRQAVGGGRKGRLGIAFGIDARSVLEAAVGGEGLINSKKWRLGRDVYLTQTCCRASGDVAGSDDHKKRLSYVMNGANGQQRLVVVGG